jgi:hypothetical protein
MEKYLLCQMPYGEMPLFYQVTLATQWVVQGNAVRKQPETMVTQSHSWLVLEFEGVEVYAQML